MSSTCALVVPWHVSGFGYATGCYFPLHRLVTDTIESWGSTMLVKLLNRLGVVVPLVIH